MASESQFMIPGQTALLEQAESLEREVSLMVLLEEILINASVFLTGNSSESCNHRSFRSNWGAIDFFKKALFVLVFKKGEFSFF